MASSLLGKLSFAAFAVGETVEIAALFPIAAAVICAVSLVREGRVTAPFRFKPRCADFGARTVPRWGR